MKTNRAPILVPSRVVTSSVAALFLRTGRFTRASLASLAVVAVLTAPVEASGPRGRDTAISAAVAEEINFSMPSASAIEAASSRGIVTLRGRVSSLLEREEAAELAKATRGVRAVLNLLKVDTLWPRTDDDILNDYRKAAEQEEATRNSTVVAEAKEGILTLSGTAASGQQRQLLVRAAKSIPGVVAVNDMVSLARSNGRTDEEIQAEIAANLEHDVYVDGTMITVTVEDSVVHLSGIVGSEPERLRVIDHAWTEGVERVDAESLWARSWAAGSRARLGPEPVRTDAALEAVIEEVFTNDPRLESAELELEVNRGVVAISGKVDSALQRKIVLEDIRNVVGVRRVSETLTIRSS